MQGDCRIFPAINASWSSGSPHTSTSMCSKSFDENSADTRRGMIFKFWKRSTTRAIAPGSASATTRSRRLDRESGESMEPMPLESRLKSKRAKSPAFDEDRAANANALLRLVHRLSISVCPSGLAQGNANQSCANKFHGEGYQSRSGTLL